MRDKVRIRIQAGRGGDGLVSFRREKYVPRGGPDGGDGGRGGNVILTANDKTPSLESIRNNGTYKAGNGQAGGKARRSGRHGADLLLQVPAGTSVIDSDSGEQLGELIEHGDKLIVGNGGQGGRGNCHFATPQNRVPQQWEPGKDGAELEVDLLFSMPAEVAVIGLPGSGKSALVRALTRSKTESGEFDFTTRRPRLGAYEEGPAARVRIIDMPALVEGASEGKGIGNRFLVHMLRVKTILFLLDAEKPGGLSLKKQYDTLIAELAAFDDSLLEKTRVVVFNKTDAVKSVSKRGFAEPVVSISATNLSGLDKLKEIIANQLGLKD